MLERVTPTLRPTDTPGFFPFPLLRNGTKAAIEVAKPVAAVIVDVALGPKPQPPEEKPLPSADKVHAILREKHIVVSEIVPEWEDGYAKMSFNSGNRHDTSFDPDALKSRVNRVLNLHSGRAPMEAVIAAGISREEAMGMLMPGMLEVELTENGREILANNPLALLHKGFEEIGFPVQYHLRAKNVEDFVASPSYQPYRQRAVLAAGMLLAMGKKV